MKSISTKRFSSVWNLVATVGLVSKNLEKMNYLAPAEPFNCSVGCESDIQCEYNSNVPSNQAIPQNYIANGNYYGRAFDDGVVPSNYYENNNQQMQCYQNYPEQNTTAMQQTSAFQQGVDSSASYSDGSYFTDIAQTYPPCQGPQPWNFAQCYGYYGEEAPCQFSNVVDMEDFM